MSDFETERDALQDELIVSYEAMKEAQERWHRAAAAVDHFIETNSEDHFVTFRMP